MPAQRRQFKAFFLTFVLSVSRPGELAVQATYQAEGDMDTLKYKVSFCAGDPDLKADRPGHRFQSRDISQGP
jgi:hypothetical protein